MIDQNVLKVFGKYAFKRMTADQIGWLSQYLGGSISPSMDDHVYLAWLCAVSCDGYQEGRDTLHKALLASRAVRPAVKREYQPDTTDMMYAVVSFRQRIGGYDGWGDFARGNEQLLNANSVFDFLKSGWGLL